MEDQELTVVLHRSARRVQCWRSLEGAVDLSALDL